ncbi:MAG: class F sortase [Nocardioidaceae bacterium]
MSTRSRAAVTVAVHVGVALLAVGATLLRVPTAPGPSAGGEGGGIRVGGGAPPPYLVEPSVRFESVPSPEAARTGPPPGRSPATAPPTRIVIPRLGVDNPVVAITAAGGVLEPPSDPQVLGWWSAGAAPGAATGGALVTGHTVHTGGGAFDHLDALRPGDPVTIRTARGTIRYAVRSVTVYRKASLARHARQVFSQSGPGRLVLVTCDDWTGTEYLSNAVVVADRSR